MCGAPDQAQQLPPGTDLTKETVLIGRVVAGTGSNAEPVGGAFVRLLDGGGEFTAEVVSSASGDFRFWRQVAPDWSASRRSPSERG